MSSEVDMMGKQVHVGMDDIDSPKGGCTTHFASLLVERLSKWNVVWSDYPNLIRLNPNIPFRTRGNGAIALRFYINEKKLPDLFPLIDKMIQDYTELDYPNTNPGVALVEGEVPKAIHELSQRALWRTIPLVSAKRIMEEANVLTISHGSGRGVIGALSAIGNKLKKDYTYEYIAYRSIEHVVKSRGVDADSVAAMSQAMGDKLFSSIDTQTGRSMIAPHGPDPVLFGIRGERPEYVVEAANHVESQQPVDRWLIFRSNQGTGAHLMNYVYVSDLRPYMAAVVHGVVEDRPKVLEGGHVLFRVGDCSGQIDCAAYEPTGKFRETISGLIKGDQVLIHAGVRPASRRHGMTLNVEGLEILKLARQVLSINPVCPQCGKRMKSAGRNKGYKCVNCGFKDPKAIKIEKSGERKLQEKLYLPPTRAQRHLTRPETRRNRKNVKTPSLIEKWSSH
jgi:tRNA(Ile2)-agmatinylcytidine synthase